MKWGVPIPHEVVGEKYKGKVFYVWFDAPIGYISITANYTKQWEKWWKNPEQVELYQFMGKDNVPFHSLIFPGSLLATGQSWTMVNGLSCTSYLNYEGGKFSKSRNTGVFGNAVQNLNLPNFVWRYYLLITRPIESDSDFTWKEFVAKNNNELLANVGNFVNRVLKFLSEKFESKVPARKVPLSEQHTKSIQQWEEEINKYIQYLEERDLKQPLHILFQLSSLGNKFWQENKPWVLLKSDLDACGTILNIITNLINCIATLFEPFLPSFSAKLFSQLNSKVVLIDKKHSQDDSWFSNLQLPQGHLISTDITPIVEEIPESRVEEFYDTFGCLSRITFPLKVKVGQIEQVENHPQGGGRYILTIGTKKKNFIFLFLFFYFLFFLNFLFLNIQMLEKPIKEKSFQDCKTITRSNNS